MLPRRQGPHTAVVSLDDLHVMLDGIVPAVELHPASGLSFTADYWVALLPELGLEHVDLGVDAALIGLANRAVEIARDRLRDGDYDENALPLLLRLWLANETGATGPLLESAARLHAWAHEGMR